MDRYPKTSAERIGALPLALAETLEELSASVAPVGRRPLVEDPLLAALRRAGSEHVYADTAAPSEIEDVCRRSAAGGEEALALEIDGNTVNQPLLVEVLERFPEGDRPRDWMEALREHHGLAREDALPLVHTIACARVANEAVRRFAAGRAWEPSLQLHMGACEEREAALRLGRLTRMLAPDALVKVPFLPHRPHCLLVARDLEREGIPVNLTSTFSARQVVVAALLAGVTRTNVFMGRIDAAFSAEKLGAQVDLEAQRALRELRRTDGVPTRLIVASVRSWRAFVDTAGCDVYTAPPDALRELAAQGEIGPGDLESRLETSWEDALGIDQELAERIGPEPALRLWRVEPELVEFLREYGASEEFASLEDGETLRLRFEEAGFGDLFHAPDPAAWSRIRRGKLPDLEGPLALRIALDTLFSLHADADFEAHQATIDAASAPEGAGRGERSGAR